MTTTKRGATQVADTFLDHCIVPFGMPTYVRADNGQQLASKFFEMICEYLVVKHLKKTAYHPQTNRQAERYNRKIVTWLSHYVADQQRNKDIFVQLLSYAHNTQMN